MDIKIGDTVRVVTREETTGWTANLVGQSGTVEDIASGALSSGALQHGLISVKAKVLLNDGFRVWYSVDKLRVVDSAAEGSEGV